MNVWFKSFLTLVGIVVGATVLTYGIEWLADHPLVGVTVLGVIIIGVATALIRFTVYAEPSDDSFLY